MPESAEVPLDVSMRVMAALSQEGECSNPPHALPLQEGETLVAQLPDHLRRLNLLLHTLHTEAEESFALAFAKHAALRAAANLFYESMRVHVPGHETSWGGKVPVIRAGWDIVLAEHTAPVSESEGPFSVSDLLLSIPPGEEDPFKDFFYGG